MGFFVFSLWNHYNTTTPKVKHYFLIDCDGSISFTYRGSRTQGWRGSIISQPAKKSSTFLQIKSEIMLDFSMDQCIIASLNNETERENTMKKLSIVINGLEYVEKTSQNSDLYYLNQLALLDDIIKQKDKEINDLQEAFDKDFGLITLDNEEKESEINELQLVLSRTEFQVAELEVELEEKECRINDLQTALEDIKFVVNRAL